MLAPFEREPASETNGEPMPAGSGSRPQAALELVWRCPSCGYQRLAVERPAQCHGCHAPGEELVGRNAIEWRFLLRNSAG